MASKRRQRSRAVLLWTIGVFLGVQLLAGLLLERLWPWVRFPDAEEVYQAAARQPQDIDIVCIGSSRFRTGVDPVEIAELLEKQHQLCRPCGVLNASVPACDPVLAEFLLTRLLEQGVQPRHLLLELSPELLSRYRAWLGYHLIRMFRWEDLPSCMPDVARTGNLQHLLSWRLVPLLLHREQILQRTGLAPAPTAWSSVHPLSSLAVDMTHRPARGRVDVEKLLRLPEAKPTPGHLELIRQSLAHNIPRRWLQHYQLRGANADALERILVLCNQRGINITLVGVPVTHTHRQAWTPDIRSSYDAYLARICAAHGCRYINAHDWLPDTVFGDNHHLTDQGKQFFSRMLALRVLTGDLCE